ncbi:uncharacterized protein LOC119688656 [Teleopsis dalmanni]|uniref:uncharacterized protein LOC119688656 n=1 Tax=Teleopsis dalmanni TaxID=139649 RepID=UPI0018CD9220|nr:uncharacterized protein LOC119688656 [Teleopsis dalmanni]
MAGYNLDLVAVQEFRQTGYGQINDEKTVFIYSGRPEREDHSRGVGFLMSKKIARSMVGWHPLYERMMALELQTGARKLLVVNVYAPTESKSEVEKEKCYDQLNSWFNSHIRRGDITLFLGDFNAKIGSDNANVKHNLGCDLEQTTTIWLPLIQKIWNEESLPSLWNEGTLVKISKKGDTKDCNNYKGITLLPIPSKIISRIILSRNSEEINKTRDNLGFRENHSCIDLINTVRIVFEQCNEFRTSVYAAFIDYKKALDSVNRGFLWNILAKRQVPTKIINVIKAIYVGFKFRVLHNGLLSNTFEVATKVRQVCILSSLVFILVVDEEMRASLKDNKGIQWNSFMQLEDVEYADDVCLLSHNIRELQENIEAFRINAAVASLEINCNKTKVIAGGYSSNSSPVVKIKEETVECVDKFYFLGSIVATKSGADEDIDSS